VCRFLESELVRDCSNLHHVRVQSGLRFQAADEQNNRLKQTLLGDQTFVAGRVPSNERNTTGVVSTDPRERDKRAS